MAASSLLAQELDQVLRRDEWVRTARPVDRQKGATIVPFSSAMSEGPAEKTVETHLGRPFRKPDISSRRQLPEVLARAAG